MWHARSLLVLLPPQFEEQGYGGGGVACAVVVGVGVDFFAAAGGLVHLLLFRGCGLLFAGLALLFCS
jgi:hypothetical protein